MFSKIRPFIFKLDPELAHDLAIKALKTNLIVKDFKIKKIAITEIVKKTVKREALFFTFLGSIKCFRWFYCKMKKL